MSNFPNPQKLAIALTVLEQFHFVRKKTLLDLDLADSADLSTFMLLVEEHAGPHCKEIELIDDCRTGDEIKLLFNVKTDLYTGYTDRDEDGAYPDTETSTVKLPVWVKVTESLLLVALGVASEVRGIENNRFA